MDTKKIKTQDFHSDVPDKTTISDTNWGGEWKEKHAKDCYKDKADVWDKRAPSFGNTRTSSPYVDQFLSLLPLKPNSTVLDMGCGNGAIAIPLAKAGHHVVARDFSKGMLTGLASEAAAAKVSEKIDAAQMSWEDDWEACGIAPKSVDVALASRSVIVQDLANALAKLSACAKQYACVTASAGYTPKMSRTILRDLGITTPLTYDDAYIYNILYQMGYFPEICYIVHDRIFHFDNIEDAASQICMTLDKMSKRFDPDDVTEAKRRVYGWIEQHLQDNELVGQINRHGETEGKYKVVVPNDIRWTFIKWNV